MCCIFMFVHEEMTQGKLGQRNKFCIAQQKEASVIFLAEDSFHGGTWLQRCWWVFQSRWVSQTLLNTKDLIIYTDIYFMGL